ncbi:MAG: hypothetical protein R3176_04920 [Woeseiaceae bacterium]|nr:hypothetical protein [Woeseiaceae bacterium]
MSQSRRGTSSFAPALRLAAATLAAAALAACGGGGGGGSKGGNGNRDINVPPSANAGPDRVVDELTLVELPGSGNDVNGDPLTYSWAQTAGQAVTLANAGTATASFTAPDVAAGSPEVLTFELTVSDGQVPVRDSVNITVREPGSPSRIAGTVSYEFVPPNANCRGLNFAATETRPMRQVTVQLLDSASGSVLATTVADDAGEYAFDDVDNVNPVRLRVRAELKKTNGLTRWDVEVRDNVDTGPSPPPLASRPLYVLESGPVDTGPTVVDLDLTAETGWTGSAYTRPRAAAPFAILDTIYSAMRLVLAADPAAQFPALDAFWSVNNALGDEFDVDAGSLPASFYTSDPDGLPPFNPSLFLLGDASDDTEEFDDHVIAHEWGHYFEDVFSRSDSIGGAHSIGDRLDPRLAFGEGWATAFAAMALDNQLYCDTGAAGTSEGFGIGAETGSYNARGWYDEISVLRFIYDMFDANDDGGGADTVVIGFQPIFDVMTGGQATTEAFTTIFSFATELRAILDPADQLGLDQQLTRADTTATGLDIWGTNEANDAGGAPDVMPIYTDLVADGSILNICSNSQFDSGRDGNKLTEDRFLRISVPVTDEYDVRVATTTPTPPTPSTTDRDQSDPDIYLYRGPEFVAAGTSPDENLETFRSPVLQAGETYIAAVEDWRFDDDEAAASYPERVCMDVSFTPTP